MSTSNPTPVPTDNLESRLCALVADVAELERDEVTPDARLYDDLLLDSLQKLEILVRVERGFGVRLADTEAAGLSSAADLARLLRGRGIG